MIVLPVSCIGFVVTKKVTCVRLFPIGTNFICVKARDSVFQCRGALPIRVPWALHARNHGDKFTGHVLTVAPVALGCSVAKPIVMPRVLEIQKCSILTCPMFTKESRETTLAGHSA